LQVVDFFGRFLSYRVASFVDRKNGSDLKPAFNGLFAANVAYGSYRYRLVRADVQEQGEFGAVDGELRVNQPELCKTLVTTGRVFIIQGHEAAIDVSGPPANYSRDGRISWPPEHPMPTWLRIQAVFGGQVVEAAVRPDGTFKIYEPLEGQFLLIVFANDRLVSVEPRTFNKQLSTEPIEIVLTTTRRP
jgi:hypothetical protein